MNGYSSVFWLALCASLTALGLVVTVLVGRKRSTRSMLHGAAWSLIPIAAYMTGSTLMLWRIGEAIGAFASAFVFSTLRWAGIGVVALIAVLFLVSGGRARRRAAREGRAARAARKQEKKAAEASADGGAGAVTRGSRGAVTSGTAGGLGVSGMGTSSASAGAASKTARQPEPARKVKAAGGKAAADDDMADIEEILRNRGLLPEAHECFDPPMPQRVYVVITRL
jgi:hypothetical protein